MEGLLKSVGLNAYEVKAYLTLLKSKPITGYELGKLCGVPQGRIYDVVESLTLKGLIELRAGAPKRFSAIDPKIAINALLTKKNNEWENTQKNLKGLISSLTKQEGISEPVAILKGEYTYYGEVQSMFLNAKKEIIGITRGLEGKKKGTDLAPIVKRKKKAGTDIKIMIPSIKEIARPLENVDLTLIREYCLPEDVRIILCDGKYCLIAIVDPNLPCKRSLIKIESEIFGKVIQEYLLSLWKKAKPIHP